MFFGKFIGQDSSKFSLLCFHFTPVTFGGIELPHFSTQLGQTVLDKGTMLALLHHVFMCHTKTCIFGSMPGTHCTLLRAVHSIEWAEPA